MPKSAQLLQFINIVVMVLLIIVVSLQNKSSGLGTAFGGSGNIVQTRRGFDKWLFYATIILGALFAGLTVAQVLVR